MHAIVDRGGDVGRTVTFGGAASGLYTETGCVSALRRQT